MTDIFQSWKRHLKVGTERQGGTLPQARAALAAWRQGYKEIKPHSSCRRMPSAELAALHRLHAADVTQPDTEGII